MKVATKLDTDSFIMCLKNFQHRRGKVSLMYGDNDINFVGAEKELRNPAKEINDRMGRETTSEFLIEWHLNPPSVSHSGGIWERQIQTIKKMTV